MASPSSIIDHLKKQAKCLLADRAASVPEATGRIQRVYHNPPAEFGLQHAQHVVAKELDFDSWQALVAANDIEVRLAVTMQKMPRLAEFGIFYERLKTEEIKRRFIDERAALRRNSKHVEWCVGWLKSHVTPTKTLNHKRGSTSWKHLAEKYHPDQYITEGVFIAAGIIAGYRHKLHNGANVHFAMSEKSATLLKEEKGGWA